jgi:hypothetical protein
MGGVAILIGLAVSGCAGSAKPRRAPGAAARPAAPPAAAAGEADLAGQWLFRAEVASAEGAASLRLVLRRFDSRRFSLQAADALGQARWELRTEGDEALWLEADGSRFCRLDPRLPLRSAQWVSSVPVADLAGLLTGEWPPEEPRPDPSELSASGGRPAPELEGRRLTGERAEGTWTSWTLWEGAQPLAWFKRRGGESVLSVRQPAVQIRWRVTARGSLGESSFVFRPGPASAELACPENAIP